MTCTLKKASQSITGKTAAPDTAASSQQQQQQLANSIKGPLYCNA
jgi:hypothetical protein